MSKLNKEELLKILEDWYRFTDNSGHYYHKSEMGKRCTQAYQQIEQIINLHFNDEWQQVKKDLGKFMKGQNERTKTKN